jgi:hypothetical protein
MAFLIGQSTATTVQLLGNFSPDDGLAWSVYVCAESGTLDTLYATFGGSGTAGNIQLAIYNADGTTKLGNTSNITYSGAATLSGAVSPGVSVVADTSYVLAITGDGNYLNPYYATGSDCKIMQPVTFPTWPGSLSRTSGFGTDASAWTIWGEGSTGGIVPQAMANYRMRTA